MSILTTPGAAFEGALAAGRSRKTTLIRNRLADSILVEGKEELPRLWTGTVVAFPASGAPFESRTTFFDRFTRLTYILDTQLIKGERGVALVLEPGTYDLVPKGGDRLFIPKTAPIILPAFPQESGWFGEDGETGLPVLGKHSQRFLWRAAGEGVLPVARDHGHRGWARCDIFLNQRPSQKFSAIYTADIESGSSSSAC